MPVLSQYWFHNGFFSGPFDVFNEPYPDGGWAWISNGSSSAATLVWNRADGEHAVDLAAQLNTGDVLAIVDKALGGQASRTEVPDPSVIAVRPQVPGVPADAVSGLPGRAGGSGRSKRR